jgi:subtilisin family serine protease
MAAPLVAAEAADLLSANTGLTTDQIVGDIVHGTVNLSSSSTSTKATLVGNSTTIKTQSLNTVHALSMNSQQSVSGMGLMGDEVSQSLGQLLANSGWDAAIQIPGVISLNSTVIAKNGTTAINIGLQDVLTYGIPELNLGVTQKLVINGTVGDIQLAGTGWSHLGHEISANTMYDVYVNHNDHLLTDSRLHVFLS